MFDLKGLGDMAKIASQAKQMQQEQNQKHQEQVNILKQIANTLGEILTELKKQKG